MMRYWFDGRLFGFNYDSFIAILLIIVLIYILRSEQANKSTREDPMRILDERLAKGEITEEEYQNLKYLLTRKDK